jgi:phenylacetate-coenzyme A ligase PaaK-like adenylate-forming protein
MSYRETVTKSSPEPGELLDSFKKSVSGGGGGNIKAGVTDLSEQSKVAENHLERFLTNISDSAGAVKVVEEFYREEHNKDLNAADPGILKEEIPDVDSILKRNKLPVFDKHDLRNQYNVEGSWESPDKKEDGTEYLVPNWVEQNPKEPYEVFRTSGTTGKPWYRMLTRNDWALIISNILQVFDDFITSQGIEPSTVNVALVSPSPGWQSVTSEVSKHLGMDVVAGDFESLMSGGREAENEARELIQHLNEGENSMLLSPVQVALRGSIGVALRRGEVDIDLFVNGGQILTDEAKEELQKTSSVQDIYGESEYPQGGGAKKSIAGTTGFELPLDSQINLVYDPDKQELAREGTGLFGYLPFGMEGQALPGVYMSGIKAELETVDGKQILQNVNRIEDEDRGCHEINRLIGI